MRSDQIKKGPDRAPARAMLRATGLKTDDFQKPFIGVCNSFTQIIPGHVHLDKVSKYVRRYVTKAGGVPIEFNTIGICDGIREDVFIVKSFCTNCQASVSGEWFLDMAQSLKRELNQNVIAIGTDLVMVLV